MGHFAKQLSAQEIKQGYALLNLMEHLDREMDLLNQQRIRVGPTTQEGQRLTQICLLYTSPSPRDLSTSRMPSSA